MTQAAVTGSAPGRLDFLGGISSYSGGLVLQVPSQLSASATLRAIPESELRFTGLHGETVAVPLDEFLSLLDYHHDETHVIAHLDEWSTPVWARCLVGCLLYFCVSTRWQPGTGLHLELQSQIPALAGLGATSALSIATLRALERFSKICLTGTDIAHLAQQAEQRIADQSSNLVDSLASAFGQPGTILPIQCQPDLLRDPITLPAGVVIVGWPSGIPRPTSEASPQNRARVAAFMGKKMFEVRTGKNFVYATNIPPHMLSLYRDLAITPSITGQEFLNHYQSVDDSQCAIFPDEIYPVGAAINFAIEENFRCQIAESLLQHFSDSRRRELLEQIGELMLLSHASYNAMGLGTPETDAMVQEVMKLGPSESIFGARISGPGCGGTVVILCETTALPVLESLTKKMIFNQDLPVNLIR